MRAVPPEERTFAYYKSIITKYYNPTHETFTEEEFHSLKKELKNGDKKAQDEFFRKSYLLALDQIAHMYAAGELKGSFEDSLQDAWEIVGTTKKIALSSKDLKSFSTELKKKIVSTFKSKESDQKDKNQDLNFDNVESLHNIEQEVPDVNGDDEEEYTALEKKNFKHDTAKILKTLRGHERRVLELRCGFNDDTPKTFKQIGAKYNVPKERICTIEARGLRKLRYSPSGRELFREYKR